MQSAGLSTDGRVLEVGSGTGAVTIDLARHAPGRTYGLDLDPAANRFAAALLPAVPFVTGDGLRLPFVGGAFAACVCHFLLLWVSDALQVLREMRRLTVPGGWVACLAEPDYGGRIDHPPDLRSLGKWQAEALRRQGADPEIGRRLIGLLQATGLEHIEGGVLGANWTAAQIAESDPTEWETLRQDLANSRHTRQLETLERADRQARQHGSRVLYVPTFFAHGRVPPG